MKNLGIKTGYTSRHRPQYYSDDPVGIIWQPDVYRAAIALARRCNLDTIIDIGSGNGLKLVAAEEDFRYVFVDFGDNLKTIKKNMKHPEKHVFIEQNFEKGFPKLPNKYLANSLVICSDVIEHIVDPIPLAKNLSMLMQKTQFVFISTPDRLRTRGIDEYGPPANVAHVREWSLEELHWFLHEQGSTYMVGGYTRSNDLENNRNTIILVGGRSISVIMKIGQLRNIRVDLPKTGKLQPHFDLYYQQKALENNNEKKQLQLKLPKQGFLDTPHADIPLNKLLSHAVSEGYTQLSLDVYSFSGELKTYDNMAVNFRQHGKIIKYLGPKTIQLQEGKSKTYPLSLPLMVLTKKRSLPRKSEKLIDGGHLNDDYLLESLLGWTNFP